MNSLCINDQPEYLKETLDILGDKYSALLIRMIHCEPQRFKDFEKNIPGISPRTLSQRLSMLEEQGIISKETCPDSPGRCQFELTEAGLELDEVLHAMGKWGMKHADRVEDAAKSKKTHTKSPLIRKI